MTKSDFSLNVRTKNGVVLISVIGRINTFSMREIISELGKLIDERQNKLILDFEKASCSKGYAILPLVSIAQRVRRCNGDLKIFGIKEDLNTKFSMAGISRILEVHQTEQEALNSFYRED